MAVNSLNRGTVNPNSKTVDLTSPQTVSNKTLTSPTINSGAANYPNLKSPQEVVTTSATAATGTINFDVLTQSILYYTSNASANFTLNFRGSGTTTLNSWLPVGGAVTVTFMNTNGASAYYPTAVQIDGVAATVRWQGAVAPSSGNASSIDAYSFTIIKTASTPTYVVLGVAVRYA